MRKLAIFSAGYALAVFAAVLILPEGTLLPLGGFSLSAAVLLCLLKSLLPDRLRRRALICCVGLAAGFVWTHGYGQLFMKPAQHLDGRTVVITGRVEEWPQEKEYGASVLVRVDLEGGGHARTLLYIDTDYMCLRPGDRIRTIASCTAATHTRGGEEITYYTAKGILLTASAYGELTWERPIHVPLSCWPAVLSGKLKNSIDDAFPAEQAALIRALVTGNRDALSDSFTTSLQRTGLSHTVAVSGMHLSYIVGLLTMILGRNRWRTALISIPLILLFTLVAGSTPSVVRAAVMAVMLQAAPLLGRRRDDFTSLGFALLVLLVYNPYAAGSVGLQLSFASVAGIMLFSGGLLERMLAWLPLPEGTGQGERLVRTGARIVAAVIATTMGAQVFTVPLVALYFETISLISPVSNLLTLWAVSGAFLGGIVTGIVGIVLPTAARIIALLVLPIAEYLNIVIPVLAKIPFASIPSTRELYRLWLIFLYALLALGILMPGKKRMGVPVCAAVVTLTAAVLFTGLSFRTGKVTIQVLDVGQGQSVLIRSEDHLVLVDCGGDSYRNAGDIAADEIRSYGYTAIDLLVISHYHDDHANGVPELIEQVNVKGIALPDTEPDSNLRRRILELAGKKKIPVMFVCEDTVLTLGEQTQVTLYPPMGKGETNELGLSVVYSAGEYDVLLTGDMGTDAERSLAAHAKLPDVELMVAGHHGSKYSNSQLLLETVCPEVAVFSVGADNPYGHPTQQAISRFSCVGAEIYRTDLMGTVTVVVSGD